jgi:outer membrane murein-binding lipoprotein Lpp
VATDTIQIPKWLWGVIVFLSVSAAGLIGGGAATALNTMVDHERRITKEETDSLNDATNRARLEQDLKDMRAEIKAGFDKFDSKLERALSK